MVVTSQRGGRVLRPLTLLAVVSIIAGSCGDGASRSDTSSPTTASHTLSSVAPSQSLPSTVVQQVRLDDLTVDLVFGRQRDLADRGLVNARTTNHGQDDLTVVARDLEVAFFDDSAGFERRRSSLPAGRTVSFQTPFGTVVDCDDPAPLSASLVLEYFTGEDPAVRRSTISVDDATALDSIRNQQCTTQAFLDAYTAQFEGAVVDEDTNSLSTRLVIERTDETSTTFGIDDLGGTVMFRPQTTLDLPIELARQPNPVEVPMTFVVNRCDPHAVAEVTKRYGLDVWIAIDGAEATPVPIDVEELVPQLEQMLERCQADLDEQ